MAQEKRKPNTEQPAPEQIQGQLSLDGFDTVDQAQDAQETEQAPEVQDVIQLNFSTDVDPELNPSSPQFNLERYKKEVLTPEYVKQLSDPALFEKFKKIMQATNEHLSSITAAVAELLKSDTYQRLNNLFSNMQEWAQALAEMPDVVDAIEPLIPYLEEEIAALRLQPGYEALTLDDVLNIMELDGTPITEIDGKPVDNVLIRAIERAKERQDTAEAAKNFEASLPRLQSMNPKKHIMPNNKLANSIADLIEAGEPRDLIVANKSKRRREITTYTSVSLDNMDGVTFKGKPYTVYDRAVHDAIVSFYVEAKRKGMKVVYFTPAIIYRVMTGKEESESPSAQAISAITRSIDKMRRNIHVTADASEEMRRRKITFNGEPVTSFIIDNFILSLTAVKITAGGKEVRGYRIDAEPILYQYAHLTGQLLSAPSNILDIREITADGTISPLSLPNTDTRIAVKSYLLRRVQVIRHSAEKAAEDQRRENAIAKREKRTPKKIEPEQKPVILLDSIFDETGIEDKDAKTDARKYIFNVLDFWTATGFIASYNKRSKGRSFDAVEITFPQ